MCAGLQQDVPGQCSVAQAPAHPWAACACLCRVWQGICGELQAQTAPVGAHRGETLPGGWAGAWHISHGLVERQLIMAPCAVPISAHLRGVASVSPWTSTCAHTCASIPATGLTCVPLRAAASALPSQPTSSPTCSRMQSRSERYVCMAGCLPCVC